MYCCCQKDTDNNGASQGSCVDNEDFVDAQGYSCSGSKYVNCFVQDMFTRMGYSRDEWQDIVQNCPASCRFCAGEMRYTIDDCTSLFQISCFRWMSLVERSNVRHFYICCLSCWWSRNTADFDVFGVMWIFWRWTLQRWRLRLRLQRLCLRNRLRGGASI